MKNEKNILLIFMALFIWGSLSLAHAQPVTAENERPGEKVREIYKQLDLTDEQKKLLESNKQQHWKMAKSLRQQMRSVREALRQELMRTQLDMGKINQLHAKLKEITGQMQDERLNSILAVRAILTPVQFSKFIGFMHKHRPQAEER